MINICDEKLKDMIYIDMNGHAWLDLTKLKDVEIGCRYDYEKRGDEADGWISREVYHITGDTYHFDDDC